VSVVEGMICLSMAVRTQAASTISPMGVSGVVGKIVNGGMDTVVAEGDAFVSGDAVDFFEDDGLGTWCYGGGYEGGRKGSED
jgi:hypothetical protein